MIWRIARDEDSGELRDFLVDREWECVSFTSRLLEGAGNRLPSRRRVRVCVLEGPAPRRRRGAAGEASTADGANASAKASAAAACDTYAAGAGDGGSNGAARGGRRARASVGSRSGQRTSTFRAAVLQTAEGFFYPVFTANGSPEKGSDGAADGAPGPAEIDGGAEQLRRVLRLGTARMHSIMGVKEHVNMLERVLRRTPVQFIEYFLMAQAGSASYDVSRLPEGITFRRATLADAELLYPLQRDYEKEEVLLEADRFDPESCYYHLRHTLRNQLVYIAELRGKPVAKAGTNARGFTYDQIGGVFTRKELRGRGVGTVLMVRLLEELNASGKMTSLFVKQHNKAAIHMYENLGYEIRNEFRISYY